MSYRGQKPSPDHLDFLLWRTLLIDNRLKSSKSSADERKQAIKRAKRMNLGLCGLLSMDEVKLRLVAMSADPVHRLRVSRGTC